MKHHISSPLMRKPMFFCSKWKSRIHGYLVEFWPKHFRGWSHETSFILKGFHDISCFTRFLPHCSLFKLKLNRSLMIVKPNQWGMPRSRHLNMNPPKFRIAPLWSLCLYNCFISGHSTDSFVYALQLTPQESLEVTLLLSQEGFIDRSENRKGHAEGIRWKHILK